MAGDAKAPALDRPVPSKSARRRHPKGTAGTRIEVTIDEGHKITVRRFGTLKAAERWIDQLEESGAKFGHTITRRIVGGASHAARPA